MRDEETVQTALSAAETGHLVFSTVHTVDASETVNRLIDFFPPHMHNQVRAMIAGTLKGAVSQRLVPTVRRQAAASPCCEVLRMTGRVTRHDHGPAADRAACPRSSPRAATTACRPSTRRSSSTSRPAAITMEEALQFASSPHDFKLLVAADGRKGTTMDDLTQAEDQRGEPQQGSVLR